MKKDKFTIPYPDDSTIDRQISQIVTQGVEKKESFPSYLKEMVQQVGWRHLFSDRLQLIFIFIIAIGLYSWFFMLPIQGDVQDLYAFIFLLSPLLFLAFSIFTYVNKTQNATYDVEMACKFTVYHVIAFRMLVFSVVSMILNTVSIAIIVMKYEGIDFLHAFLLSSASLFLFSFILSYGLMNRRTKGIVIGTVLMWIIGNTVMRATSSEFYNGLLLNLPVLVYVVILLASLVLYMNYLKKLIVFKQSEGVF